MSLKKQYLKSKVICKVTFYLPKEAAENAETANLVGSFNNWTLNTHPMQRLKNGDFKTTIELRPDSEYEFRYLLDGHKWINDWHADKYIPSPHPYNDNSVVVV